LQACKKATGHLEIVAKDKCIRKTEEVQDIERFGKEMCYFTTPSLANIGITVLPDQQAIPLAFKAFDNKGSLTDDRKQKSVLGLGRQLAIAVSKLSNE